MEAARNVVSDQDLKPWLREKFAKWFGMVKLGHEGIMLERVQRQLKASEIAADISMKGTTEGVDSLYPQEDDMGVNIGNEIHYHYEANSPKDATVTPDPTPTVPTTPTNNSGKNPIWPLILVGAMGLSGLAGSFLAYHAAHKPQPVQPTPSDTDNVTDVTFPK